MSKKVAVTQAEIEKDIINAIKQPQEMTKASYQKLTLPCIISAVVLVVLELIYPKFVFWVLLALAIFLIIIPIADRCCLKRRMKNVSFNDYEIKTEVVANTTHESYVARGAKWRSKRVNNYTIRFENGEIWRIPQEDNYRWNDRLRLSAFGVYQSTHRGDVFLVVIKKDTGKIVMAYHTDVFEYKK